MEAPLQTQQGLLRSITRDCDHILEAIRRLRDGTWQLSFEDADWVNFLFPKIKSALQDHIEYENLYVFPQMNEDLVKEHSAAHEKIAALLWALDQSRINCDSERFHTLLDILVNVIHQHHEEFCCPLPHITLSEDECPMTRILRRAKGSSLEKS